MKHIDYFVLLTCLLLPAFVAAQSDMRIDTVSVPISEIRTLRFKDDAGRTYSLQPISEKNKNIGRGGKGWSGWNPSSSRHDLRLGIGAYVINSNCSLQSCFCVDPLHDLEEYLFYDHDKYTTGAISLSYGYRLAKRCEVGIAFSYCGESWMRDRVADGNLMGRFREDHWSVLPFVRLLWMDRRLVRLYSGLGIGVQWRLRRNYDGSKSNEFGVTGHLTMFGITVGRQLFGFAEYGFGGAGLIVGGIGYRFDATKKK